MTADQQREARERLEALKPHHFAILNPDTDDPWEAFADYGPTDLRRSLDALDRVRALAKTSQRLRAADVVAALNGPEGQA